MCGGKQLLGNTPGGRLINVVFTDSESGELIMAYNAHYDAHCNGWHRLIEAGSREPAPCLQKSCGTLVAPDGDIYPGIHIKHSLVFRDFSSQIAQSIIIGQSGP